MKFVASTDFNNAPELALSIDKKTEGFKHEKMVHKGHRFEIAPGANSLKAVTKESDKVLISKLVLYGFAVVDDGTPESKDAITKIDAEAKAETAAAEAHARNRPLSVPEQIAKGVAEALAQLKAAPAK
jgi:hypothetical protein